MRYLVFSDIHGNLPALERMLSEEKDVDGYLNLGDVVNYGPWSNECLLVLEDLPNSHHILGNHDAYFQQGTCPVESALVQAFFKQTYGGFEQHALLEKCQEQLLFEDVLLIHTLGEKDYVFRDSPVTLSCSTMLGHSHQQFLRYKEGYLLLNPGSVGQNRKYINRSNYAIWDIETGEIVLKEQPMDIDLVLGEMRAQNYPSICVDYYNNKKRL